MQCGFNAEGGTANALFSIRDTHSDLCNRLIIQKKNHFHPGRSFFLRAESYYNVLTNYDRIDETDDDTSHHNFSHGESFVEATKRFIGKGLYLLDEPEAALSPNRLMSLICMIHEALQNESQFIIATHSPILMSYPGAELYLFDEDGFSKTDYRETDHYCITKRFLENPERMHKELFK